MKGPVIAGTVKIGDTVLDSDSETDNFMYNEDQSIPATLGGTSNLTCVLSQEHQTMNVNACSDPVVSYTVKDYLEPIITKAISSCKTQPQILRFYEAIRDCYYKNRSEEK